MLSSDVSYVTPNMRFINTLIAALVIVFLYNILFFQVDLGLGLGVFYILLHVYFFISRNKKTPYFPFAVSSSVLSVLFAFLYALRANPNVQSTNFVSAIF